MASKYETKTLPELQRELMEKHKDKQIEWWAKQLAVARQDAFFAEQRIRAYIRSEHDKERNVSNLETINKSLVTLLKKAGFQQARLRVTEEFYECKYNDGLTQEQKDEGEECWGDPCECDECEECYKKKAVSIVCAYDYSIVDDALRYIGADLEDGTTEYEDLLKVEDVTNPKKPIVIWEATK